MSDLVSKTVDYTEKARAGVTTHAADGRPATEGQVTASYPRGGLGAGSRRDEIMRDKLQYQSGTDRPFGELTASDADFRWLQRKRDTQEKANLDAWIGKNFHRNDVAARKWLQEVYPEYYEARERLMADRAKLALRIHLLKLRGPKNEEDLILQWGLQTGRIELEPGWDQIGFTEDVVSPGGVAAQHARFGKHLFKPKRLQTDTERNQQSIDAGNPFRSATGGPGGGQYDPTINFPGYAVDDPRYPNTSKAIRGFAF